MNEEILKLAKATGRLYFSATNDELEPFYRAAYNKAIEDAANKLLAIGALGDGDYLHAIRALEMK